MSALDFLIGLAALGVLLLPGWLAARAARVSQPLLAGFVAATVALAGLVLLFTIAGVGLTAFRLGVVWFALTVLTAWGARRSLHMPHASAARYPWREHWPLFLALVPAMAVVAYRATAQPLSGIDAVFRWNYLAQQILARGSLGFYPPVTSADYAIYAWPDGIAPAVSSLYYWVYALAGAARPTLTAPLVILQYDLLVAATFALARRMFGDRAAAFASALVAASPVVSWATAMGQETGLTALSLVALFLYLPQSRDEENAGGLIAAGLAAGLGALAREYGLAFIALGLALGVARRLSWRGLGLYGGSALLSALPWYLRNWVRTGNPLFNLDLGGVFPVNVVHTWMNQSYQAEFSASHLPAAAGWFLVANCVAALLGGLAGALVLRRPARGLLGAAAMVGVIWFASLGYTAAGFTTAIRVLSPALALGAVLGGGVCARWISGPRYLLGASLALGLLSFDAGLRALTLPGTVYKIPCADWLAAGRASLDYHARPAYAEVARVAGAQRILVLGPNAQLNLRGAHTLPLWSPEVSFLFDRATVPAATARRLRAAGVGFILLNGGAANERFLAHSPYLCDPGDTLQARRVDDMILLQIIVPRTQ